MTDTGDLDYDILQQKLNEYRNYNSLKVCAISAGSNLTGIMFDVDRISVMCHKADFVVCFDYAAVCPYTDINFNGIRDFLFIIQKNFFPDNLAGKKSFTLIT